MGDPREIANGLRDVARIYLKAGFMETSLLLDLAATTIETLIDQAEANYH